MKLKLCPFCGEQEDLIPIYFSMSRVWRICCGKCNTDGPSRTTERKAQNSWNIRSWDGEFHS